MNQAHLTQGRPVYLQATMIRIVRDAVWLSVAQDVTGLRGSSARGHAGNLREATIILVVYFGTTVCSSNEDGKDLGRIVLLVR